MPTYLRTHRIDWFYDRASPEQKPILQEANARLSSRFHTADTFEEQIRSFAAQRPDAVAAALIEADLDPEMGDDAFLLFLVRDGTVRRVDIERNADGSFSSEPELAARLLRGDFTPVPPPPLRDGQPREQSLYFPIPMLEEIQEQAARLDRSLSWVVTTAWDIVREDVIASDNGGPLCDAGDDDEGAGAENKRKQTLLLPTTTLQEIKDVAAKLDRSLSWVVQRSFRLARSQIRAMPPKSA